MFQRVLFMLLLALNIGGAGWIAFAPTQAAVIAPPTDPGVAALVLLSERDSDKATSATAAGVASSTDVCTTLGPFPTQSDMRAVLNVLTPQVKRIQYRNARSTQSRGYWVFLAAMNTREEALGVARALSAKGVRDYYVVTAGDQQNTVSLGLFREQGNAERRRAEISAMGFNPELIQRTEELPVYWIDFARDPEHVPTWRARVPPSTDVREQAIDCF